MKTAVLVSGGLDSAACLNFLADNNEEMELIPYFCTYGSKLFWQEYKAAIDVVNHFMKKFPNVRSLEKLDCGHFGPSLLTYGKVKYFAHPAYVPARDPLLVLHVASMVECNADVTHIAIGTHHSDADANFPDCTIAANVAISNVLQQCLSRKLTLWAPFSTWTKEMIIAYVETNCPEVRPLVFSGYGDLMKGVEV